MVASARPVSEPAGLVGRRPGDINQGVPGDLAGLTPAPWPAIGVRIYAAPTPAGPVLVVPEEALADLRDTGYVLQSAAAPVRVDLLVAAPLEPGVPGAPGEGATGLPFDEGEVVTLLRRAAAAATLAADPSVHRQAAVGPAGPWYATLLAWGWLLLIFAAQSPAQVLGALWLVAGLPATRQGYRRRQRAWGRRGAAGLHAVAGEVSVRPLFHTGLAHLAAVLARDLDDPPAALRGAAQACPDAGLAGLAPFYAALAAGATPAGIWTPLTPVVPPPSPRSGVPGVLPLASPPGVETSAGAAPTVETKTETAPVEAAEARETPAPAGEGETEGGALRTSSTPT